MQPKLALAVQQSNTGASLQQANLQQDISTSRTGTIEDQSPSFKVAKVSQQNPRDSHRNLHTSELLKSASIYARDLYTEPHESVKNGVAKVP
jgi:hypothetical protein